MAVTNSDRIVRLTADADLFDSGLKALSIKGVRLVAGSAADATAVIRKSGSSGDVVFSLAAVQKTADECQLGVQVDVGALYLTLTGAGAEVFVYLD